MRAKVLLVIFLTLAVLLGLLWLHFTYLNRTIEISLDDAVGGQFLLTSNLGLVSLSMVIGSIVLLIAWKLFYLLAFLPMHLRHWNNRRKERKRLQNIGAGLQAMVVGDPEEQRKNFNAVADAGVAPAAFYYMAASAATEEAKRRSLLKKAAGAEGDPMIQAMATAQLRLNANMPAEAAEVLRVAGAATAKASRPLALLLEACEKSGDIRSALDVAQTLLERSPSPSPPLQRRIGRLAGELLKNEGNPEAIHGLIGAERKSHPSSPVSIALAAAQRLAAVNDEKRASNVLSQAWSQSQDTEVLEAIAKYGSTELVNKILEQSDDLLRTRGDDVALMCALADLAVREQIWGQARKLLKDALRIKETRAVYLRLAKLAESEGKSNDESNRLFRLAAQASD